MNALNAVWTSVNLVAGWGLILLGFVAGAVEGLFFHRVDWRGGYAAWPRRLTRLAHVSFFGIGLLNLAFAFTVRLFEVRHLWPGASPLLVFAGLAMPTLCYLSAWKRGFRHLFFLPVLSLFVSVTALLMGGLR